MARVRIAEKVEIIISVYTATHNIGLKPKINKASVEDLLTQLAAPISEQVDKDGFINLGFDNSQLQVKGSEVVAIRVFYPDGDEYDG